MSEHGKINQESEPFSVPPPRRVLVPMVLPKCFDHCFEPDKQIGITRKTMKMDTFNSEDDYRRYVRRKYGKSTELNTTK